MTDTIHRTIPPQRLITAVNPLVRLALRSPLHRLLDGSVLILHVTGRRTGRCYDIPVGFTDLGDRLLVVTQHRWRRNLRGGATVQVTRFGRRVLMRADLDEDPATVATLVRTVIDRLGRSQVKLRLGLVVEPGHDPDLAELTEAIAAFDLGAISLRPV